MITDAQQVAASVATPHPTPQPDPRLDRILDALSHPAGDIDPGLVRSALRSAGIHCDDDRLGTLAHDLGEWGWSTPMPRDRFLASARSGMLLLERAVSGQLIIPDFATFRQGLGQIFEQTEADRDGAVADYIPMLARRDPERFGLAVCTVDGQRASFGDSREPFTSQCIHKPLTYSMAVEDRGADFVQNHVGCEPSGRGFNEIALNDQGRPHNPMLNAGSILCSALFKPELGAAERFEHVLDTWQRLSGGRRPGFDNATYLSERRTADRNCALMYFMKEHGAFPEGVSAEDALDTYLQACSVEVDAELVSVVAATLAAGGICPLTGQRVLQPETVQKCLTFMYSCGMYDYSGRWAFRIGLPAKSGVSGGVMVVVPNVMGFCVWSPRLEPHGNSVRAIRFCERLVERYNFHNYDSVLGTQTAKIDPRLRPEEIERDLLVDLCWAASEGDTDGIRRLIARGADVNASDYDRRTALHLAASEGWSEAVTVLLRAGAHTHAVDRWGATPQDSAAAAGHNTLAELLSE